MSYFDIKAVSNSSLNYIDPESGGNPRLFRKFLDGQLEQKSSKSFEIGTLIHEELLEPGKLDIVSEQSQPKTISNENNSNFVKKFNESDIIEKLFLISV